MNFGKGADIRCPTRFLVGNHVGFGKNFTCEVDAVIGSEVLISSNVAFVGRDHRFDDPGTSVYFQGRSEDNQIVIGSDVLIGFGTIVIGPVSIGDGCIVGAGSVVSRDLPPGMVCAGVPARAIKPRHESKRVA